VLTYALLQVFLIILLVAANAFFVAAEFALVSVRDTRVQQLVAQRRIGARTVQKLQHNLDDVLAAVQFGITLASLALGWIGEPTIAQWFMKPLSGIPYAGVYAHLIGVILAFSIITWLHVILGEVVPKSMALTKAERVALSVAGPMDLFMTLSKPALWLTNKSSRIVLKVFGTQQVREGGVHSPDELKLIVTASSRVGMLPALQEDMIHRALDLGNLTAREIMVPRNNMFTLPSDMPLDEAMSKVVEEQHSRVPVHDPKRGKEHIVGLLYSKDLSRFMHFKLTAPDSAASKMKLKVSNVMRDVMFVPETKPLNDLLEEFKKRKRHLAIVVDEFGSTVGSITVEDVLEQLVGEMEDEFDVVEQPSMIMASGALVLNGAENIRDLETKYRLMLPRDQGFETLAGFMLSELGNIPTGGETVEHDGRRYIVLTMEGHRIAKVKVEPIVQPAEEENA
jgi:CBS domain containing-hemolysin-like protein